MANVINLIQAMHTVADANKELWDGFAVEEPEGVIFTDEFTDDMWNKYVTVPEGSKVTAAAVRAIMPQHLEELALRNVQLKRIREYPDWGSQLDYIYHNGIEKWKTDIVDPVKAKYPKPE
jgi:hypothetical protein